MKAVWENCKEARRALRGAVGGVVWHIGAPNRREPFVHVLHSFDPKLEFPTHERPTALRDIVRLERSPGDFER